LSPFRAISVWDGYDNKAIEPNVGLGEQIPYDASCCLTLGPWYDGHPPAMYTPGPVCQPQFWDGSGTIEDGFITGPQGVPQCCIAAGGGPPAPIGLGWASGGLGTSGNLPYAAVPPGTLLIAFLPVVWAGDGFPFQPVFDFGLPTFDPPTWTLLAISINQLSFGMAMFTTRAAVPPSGGWLVTMPTNLAAAYAINAWTGAGSPILGPAVYQSQDIVGPMSVTLAPWSPGVLNPDIVDWTYCFEGTVLSGPEWMGFPIQDGNHWIGESIRPFGDPPESGWFYDMTDQVGLVAIAVPGVPI